MAILVFTYLDRLIDFWSSFHRLALESCFGRRVESWTMIDVSGDRMLAYRCKSKRLQAKSVMFIWLSEKHTSHSS
jgi:hypothetical protein